MENHNSDFVTDLKKFFEAQAEATRNNKELNQFPESIRSLLYREIEIQVVLIVSNLYAQFRQDIALRKVQAFLEDDSVIDSFAKYLQSLAATSEQLRDYPGLLELLATHVEQERHNNILQTAIQRSAPEPAFYAREFLQHASGKPGYLPKELSAAIGVMEVVAGIVESQFSLTREDFLSLFADRIETWPAELYARLVTFASGKTHERWSRVQSALEPFVRPGRLPAAVNQKSIAPPKEPKSKRSTIPEKGASISPVMPKVALARRSQDHKDVIGNTEKEPISHFAVLQSQGDKSGMRFELVTVDNLEELFGFSNLDDYIKAHSEDRALRPMLEAAIQHLTVNPKDPAHTKRLQIVRYILGEGTHERAPWRFSPQHFPRVAKGPIAAQTRIIYDILNHEGNPTLVVYGAFIKGDLHMSKLPRR